jgi:hypothetical protein
MPNTDGYYEICPVLLLMYGVVTAVKAMCKYCGGVFG